MTIALRTAMVTMHWDVVEVVLGSGGLTPGKYRLTLLDILISLEILRLKSQRKSGLCLLF